VYNGIMSKIIATMKRIKTATIEWATIVVRKIEKNISTFKTYVEKKRKK